MEKSVKVIRTGKTYIVRLESETIENKHGLSVTVLRDNEVGERLIKHFLDFSIHPEIERESNMIKFIDHFDLYAAAEWVDGYLRIGKKV